ncbi:MAG TPA: pyruvate formate lyase-activating protein [Ruminiclostridium sp.]|jgi:pyruvate formate lyase activating enzyme|nr:pyruvate formate lyase-activating protein [Ruminiclostridium sp.]
MNGRIHSFETFGTVDGPGIRFVVFLQGCNFLCVYCHNPDTWPLSAGSEYSAEETAAMAARYKPYFTASGGGITVSGGEPLLQIKFVTELFRLCRTEGIHTCLDTNGSACRSEELDELMKYTDLVLLDIKHTDPGIHEKIAGAANKTVLSFAKYLDDIGKPFHVRTVIVPGLTDSPAYITALKNFCSQFSSLEKIELLPFHKTGEYKWKELGISYSLGDVPPASNEKMEELNRLLNG